MQRGKCHNNTRTAARTAGPTNVSAVQEMGMEIHEGKKAQKDREGDQNPLELSTLSESELGLLFGLLSACAKYSKLLINTPAMANGLAKSWLSHAACCDCNIVWHRERKELHRVCRRL